MHPLYLSNQGDWIKFRDTYKGGKDFVEKYLQQFSRREDPTDFASRKTLTYSPSYAKAAVNDVKNSIYQRMADIKRIGGPESYARACLGLDGGVDGKGNTMTSFMGRTVLEELLVIGKVGIFVDREDRTQLTAADRLRAPYVYVYTAEQIQNWDLCTTGLNANITKAHLFDTVVDYDEDGFPSGNLTRERKYWLTNEGVKFEIKIEDTKQQGTLALDRLPLEISELSGSLLEDIADIQIALLQVESSDLNFILKGNNVFYVEPFDPRTEATHLKQGETDNSATKKDIDVGSHHGRRYPVGTNEPNFINPSPEPLMASMKKQADMRAAIRYLINLNISNLQARATSAESKGMDDRSLEAGLSLVGLELERAERGVADIWCQYEGTDSTPTISYPKIYTIKTFDQALDEAQKIEERMKAIPSPTFKKEMAKVISRTVLGNNVDSETLTKIEAEIDKADILNTDPQTILKSHEQGLLPGDDANKALGYPDGSYDRAKKDHAERLARIQKAQTPLAPGVDNSPESKELARNEKEVSQNADTNDAPTKAVRGDAN